MSIIFQVVRSLERRWVEIVDGRTFVGVLHYPECFSEQYLVKLEDRMTELAETLSTSDLVLVSEPSLMTARINSSRRRRGRAIFGFAYRF